MAALLLATVTACGPSGSSDGKDEKSVLHDTVFIGGKTDQPGFNLHAAHTDRGLEVDLANYLGRELDFNPKFHDVVSAKREQELKERSSALVIATYSITPDRERQVDFVGPYLVTGQGFLIREDYQGLKTEKDVAGKVICTAEGSTSAVAQLPRGTTRHIETDYSTCVRKLQAEAVDAVFTDEALLYGFVEQQKNSKVPLKVAPGITSGQINRYGIGLRKGHTADCKKLLRALRTYLTEEWATDVRAQLRALVHAYPGDWENRFRPDPEDLNRYSSCET
ncbi:transporter substrate-binding domain-containing protein [Streptomyces hygroscopicus]|uniref:transporter substrate-binding domain-containing protein n=1 Tax=Streptomyces hygroscopicus TaxID=1912 RepID=UPI00362DF253